MSIIKVKEISLINTPPQDRLPIKTIIAESFDEIIKNVMRIKNIKVTATTLRIFDCIFSLFFNFCAEGGFFCRKKVQKFLT